MTLDAFLHSLAGDHPPSGLAAPLLALWHDGRGDWARAHETIQHDEHGAAAHVHAYLHRKEGDLANARYWYRRAPAAEHHGPLEDEWRELVTSLLKGAA
jgi:hypothetical protein